MSRNTATALLLLCVSLLPSVANAASLKEVAPPALTPAQAAAVAQAAADRARVAAQAAADVAAGRPPAPGAAQGAGAQNQGSDQQKQGDLQGLGFGVALGVSFPQQANITSTIVQNNVVRVTNGDKTNLGFWLELHHFWGMGTPTKATDGSDIYAWGFGPFVGVQASADNKIIQSLGAGMMIGVRRDKQSQTAINLGIGYAAMQINVLTDGISANQPLPTGISAVTTRTKIVGGPFIMTSFSF